MKKTILLLTIGFVLVSCSEESNDEASNNQSSKDQNLENEEESTKEFYNLEIVNFIKEEEKTSFDKLPFSFNSFDYSKVGALYDESSNTLSIYFANFEKPSSKYGMCCGQTESGDQKTLSFIIKHTNGNEINRKTSFINFTDTSTFRGLNMSDRTMNGEYKMKDGYVEGELIYVNDLDSTAFIKTTFKLKLD